MNREEHKGHEGKVMENAERPTSNSERFNFSLIRRSMLDVRRFFPAPVFLPFAVNRIEL